LTPGRCSGGLDRERFPLNNDQQWLKDEGTGPHQDSRAVGKRKGAVLGSGENPNLIGEKGKVKKKATFGWDCPGKEYSLG